MERVNLLVLVELFKCFDHCLRFVSDENIWADPHDVSKTFDNVVVVFLSLVSQQDYTKRYYLPTKR
jgi:hypothetical protein